MNNNNIYSILKNFNKVAVEETAKPVEAKPKTQLAENMEQVLGKKLIAEKAANKYAVGMSQAMKSTGDKPPLKKSTIVKAHGIAKKVKEDRYKTIDDYLDAKRAREQEHGGEEEKKSNKRTVVGHYGKHYDPTDDDEEVVQKAKDTSGEKRGRGRPKGSVKAQTKADTADIKADKKKQVKGNVTKVKSGKKVKEGQYKTIEAMIKEAFGDDDEEGQSSYEQDQLRQAIGDEAFTQVQEFVNQGADPMALPDELYDVLYDHYQDEMPYGTQKARDGDPYEWISEKLMTVFGDETTGMDESWDDVKRYGKNAVVGATLGAATLGGVSGDAHARSMYDQPPAMTQQQNQQSGRIAIKMNGSDTGTMIYKGKSIPVTTDAIGGYGSRRPGTIEMPVQATIDGKPVTVNVTGRFDGQNNFHPISGVIQTNIAKEGVTEVTGDKPFDKMMGNIVKGAGALKKKSSNDKFEQVYDRVEVILMQSGIHSYLDEDIEDALVKLKIKPTDELIADELIERLETTFYERASDVLNFYTDIDESQQGVAEDRLEEIDRRGFLKGLGAAALGAAGIAATGNAQARATPEWMAKVAQAKELLSKGLTPEQVAKKLGVTGPNNNIAGSFGGDWGAINYAAREVQQARGTSMHEGVAEGDVVRPDVMRHPGDKTVKVLKKLDEGMMDKIKGMLVPKLMKLLGPDAEKIASAVKQATGGDLTPSKENAIKVVQALGLDKAAAQGQSPQMAEGIAGNWQGKLIQSLYTLGLLGSVAVTNWAMGPGRGTQLGVASELITVIGVVLLMFAKTFFSSDRGMVGAMGQHGNKGFDTNKGPDSLGENDLKPWERTMKEDAEEDKLDEAEKCAACDCDPCECDESVAEIFEQTLGRMREIAGIKEAKKPDFLDMDKDGDKKEPMKKAIKDKEQDDELAEMMRLSGVNVDEDKLADKDYDKDGKIETGSEEHAGSVDKAIKKNQVTDEEKVDECMGSGMMSPVPGQAMGQSMEQEGKMNINTNMSSDGTKSVSISADGEAAVQLMQMLKLAGMGGQGPTTPQAEPEVAVISTEPEAEVDEEKDPRYQANTSPEEHVMPVQALTKGGDGDVAGKEKAMTPNGYQFGDNPRAMREAIQGLDNFGHAMMKEYESIKIKK